jgi:hypothetical protein
LAEIEAHAMTQIAEPIVNSGTEMASNTGAQIAGNNAEPTPLPERVQQVAELIAAARARRLREGRPAS